MKKRSPWFVAVLLLSAFASILFAGCGKNFYFAGRDLPPSGILNRVVISIQNPSPFSEGALQIVDANYDIRHSFDNKVASFSINGYAGMEPVTIQNLPEQQAGAVYGAGDGSFNIVDYATEANTPGAIKGFPGGSSSIFLTRDMRYIFAASQTAHVLTVMDRTAPANYFLNLPGIYRISVNPSGSVALAFIQNSDQVYSVLHLQNGQPRPSNAEDCEPQNLPVYCVVPVTGSFDRPTRAVFSSDGTTAYVLNCGPECGGRQASVSYLPVAGTIIQSGSPVPVGATFAVTATVPIPGGVTDALPNGNTLYLAGQQLQPDGYLAGRLTVLDTSAQQITGTYPISDGTHTRMVLGDDNTLWIGSTICTEGERNQIVKAGGSIQLGCLTMFNTANNSVFVDSYKGDLNGVTAVTGLHKVYVAEGGQVHIYNTPDGSERDNSNVTVVGTASDVAYMDAASDDDNTVY